MVEKKSLDYCVIYRQINAHAVGMNAVAVKTIFRFILQKKNNCLLQHEIKVIKWQEVSTTFLIFKLES